MERDGEISEQRLADQARAIRINGWLSEVELEEIKRELRHDMQRGETVDDVENHPHQGEEEHTENWNDHPHEYSEKNVEDVVCRMEREGCNADQIQLTRGVLDSLKNESDPPPNLRNIERRRLSEKVNEVNKILTLMETKDITQTNELLLAAGRVVAKRLGVKQRERRPKIEPW